jgi:hypothetical protein
VDCPAYGHGRLTKGLLRRKHTKLWHTLLPQSIFLQKQTSFANQCISNFWVNVCFRFFKQSKIMPFAISKRSTNNFLALLIDNKLCF